MNYTDKQKKDYLIGIVKEFYSQGDDYFASKSKNGNWHFGNLNDHSLQHGGGQSMMLKDKVVSILISRSK